MPEIKELKAVEEVDQVLQQTNVQPVFIFKHSTTCPVSAEAYEQFKGYIQTDATPYDAYYVNVGETREVSDELAEKLDVQHQSPQIFLVKDGEAVWNTSHSDITVENIIEAVEEN